MSTGKEENMTYEQLKEANELITTTDIKGKDYAEVNQRIKAFRSIYPDGCIESEIVKLEDGVVTIKATVRDPDWRILSTGYAQEVEGSTYINKTSFIENCETSAVGRALGMLGIGIDTSVASADEVENAIKGQEKIDDVKVKALMGLAEEKDVPIEDILKRFKVKRLEDLSEVQHIKAVRALESTK